MPWNWMPPPSRSIEVEAVEHAHEVEVPPGAAELAVGHRLEPGVLLHPDDVDDRLVLDRLELLGRERLVLEVGLARGLDRGGPEEAADDVGAERRGGHGGCGTVALSNLTRVAP